MTTIGIQNPKLIVTNHHQFLAHFHISDEKPKKPYSMSIPEAPSCRVKFELDPQLNTLMSFSFPRKKLYSSNLTKFKKLI